MRLALEVSRCEAVIHELVTPRPGSGAKAVTHRRCPDGSHDASSGTSY